MTTLSILNDFLERRQQDFSSQPLRDRPRRYTLKWRQNHLVLRLASHSERAYLSSPESKEWLVDRLQRSPIQRVSLSPELTETELTLWANACAEVSKAVYLQVPNTPELPKKNKQLLWWVKRAIDWSVATLLLLVFSPLLLTLAVLIRLQSPGPIFFCQWRVGERGKLFRICKFRTMVVDAEQFHHQVMGNQPGLHKHRNDPRVTPLGRWMRKYSLDELPQLINVLRGEMSLVGPRPWALYDALRISSETRHRLNALPGITGFWQVSARSHLRDINAVNQADLQYLRHWSLWQDLKILLMTLPKVMSGFGAY